jgi:hypothetical protein
VFRAVFEFDGYSHVFWCLRISYHNSTSQCSRQWRFTLLVYSVSSGPSCLSLAFFVYRDVSAVIFWIGYSSES